MTIKEIEVKTIISKTDVPPGDFCINPYIGCPHKCIYCYAEFMKSYTAHGERWGDFLDVKRCDVKINPAKFAGKSVVLSTVTDAYNPFEKKYGITREILSKFEESEANILILTKSDLVLRDLDILKKIPHIKAGFSINTLVDSLREKIEPGAPGIDKRINALRVLKEEGIPCYVSISPIFPGLTDFKAIIEACTPYTREFHFENLNLRSAHRPRVLSFVAKFDATLRPLYDDIYICRDNSYWEAMEGEIIDFCTKRELKYISYFYHEKIKKQK